MLSVHLFNDFAGREVDGDPGTTYQKRQFEIAKESDASQLIWVPNSLGIEDIEEKEHKEFLVQPGWENSRYWVI